MVTMSSGPIARTLAAQLTILVPAYNEEQTIGASIRS